MYMYIYVYFYYTYSLSMSYILNVENPSLLSSFSFFALLFFCFFSFFYTVSLHFQFITHHSLTSRNVYNYNENVTFFHCVRLSTVG